MEKIIITLVICIIVLGCRNDKDKFSEIPLNYSIDSVKYIAVIEKDSKTIKNDNDINTVKNALSKSYRINHKSRIKLPPYTGTMTMYCDEDTFVYKIYGNIFVSGDNTLYMSPINLSWTIMFLEKNTHWTQDTEELHHKRKKSKEEIDSIKQK